MTSQIRLALLCTLVLTAGSALAQITKQSNGYLFRLKLHKGEKLNFKIPFSIENLEDKPLNLHFGMKLTVSKLTSKGIATVVVGKPDTGNLSLPMSVAGGSFEVDRLGRVQADGQTLAGFCIRYPQDPVAVGGHFVSTVRVLSGGTVTSGAQDAQATFTFIGFSGIGKHKCAKLTFKVAGNRAPAGSILVRLTDGVIDRYFTHFTAVMSGGASGRPLVVTATIERQ